MTPNKFIPLILLFVLAGCTGPFADPQDQAADAQIQTTCVTETRYLSPNGWTTKAADSTWAWNVNTATLSENLMVPWVEPFKDGMTNMTLRLWIQSNGGTQSQWDTEFPIRATNPSGFPMLFPQVLEAGEIYGAETTLSSPTYYDPPEPMYIAARYIVAPQIGWDLQIISNTEYRSYATAIWCPE